MPCNKAPLASTEDKKASLDDFIAVKGEPAPASDSIRKDSQLQLGTLSLSW